MKPSPAPRYDSLTSLRFFAALHVLLFHLQGSHHWAFHPALEHILGTGFVSVSFFFVLSGFILTVSYSSRPPRAHLLSYFTSRFARIYPLYFLGLVLMLPGWLRDWNVGASIATPLLGQAWVPPWALAWNPPAWSLSVEAFFYFMFPFLLPLVQRAALKRLWTVAFAAWGGGLLLSVAYVLGNPDGLTQVDDSSQAFWLNALKFHPLIRLPEFVVGMTLGRTILDQRWPAIPHLGKLSAGTLVLGLMASHVVPYPVLHNGLFTPLFVMLIASAAQKNSSLLNRTLSHSWLVTLGEASYALYILQTPLLSLVNGLTRRLWPTLGETPWLFGLSALAVTLLGSVMAWALVERPMRLWLVQRLSPLNKGS